jgi:hypothetical protein
MSIMPPPTSDRDAPGTDGRPQESGFVRGDSRDERPMPPPDFRSVARPPPDVRPPPNADMGDQRPRANSGTDDRRVPLVAAVNARLPSHGAPPSEARQLLPSDRDRDRVPPVLEERGSRPAVPPSPKNSPVRLPVDRRPLPASASLDHRGPPPRQMPSSYPADSRPPPSLESRVAQQQPRAPLVPSPTSRNPPRPLEERLKPVPAPTASLQDRLSDPNPRPDERSTGPPLLDRLSTSKPTEAEDRSVRPGPPSRDNVPARPIMSLPDRRPKIEPIDDPSRLLADEPRRPPPVDDRRGRPVADNYRTPPTAHTRPLDAASYGAAQPPPPPPPRAASAVRDDLRDRAHPPKSSPPSPASRPSDYRYSREPRDEPDRSFRAAPERRVYEDRRADDMDVDHSRRPAEPAIPPQRPPLDDRGRNPAPRSYERPPDVTYPPPVDRYDGRRDYYDDKAYKPEPERAKTWSSDARESWDRERQAPGPAAVSDRERYYSREPSRVSNGWETKEEHDRRAVSPTHSQRSYDPAYRPLTSRLTDGYPSDDRARTQYPPRDVEGGRYPEPAPSYSRVRPRSPSPTRRDPLIDDFRPPVKRLREDSYVDPYYEPSRRDVAGTPASYPPPRRGSPRPAAYYDPAPYAAGSRDPREYPLPRDRSLDPTSYNTLSYDGRSDIGRPRASPPPAYARDGYERPPMRDDRRYPLPTRP